MPLVAFRLRPHPKGSRRMYDEFNLSDKLKESGWTLPAYTMAPDAGHVKLLRAVSPSHPFLPLLPPPLSPDSHLTESALALSPSPSLPLRSSGRT